MAMDMHGTHADAADTWLRTVKRSIDPRVRLVCFPHVGGAASFFAPWEKLTPADVELIGVRYPGREDRLLDPFAETVRELAEPIARACSGLLDKPLALFGHSMGASVAHETARCLEREYGASVAALFVSGRPGPGRQETGGRYAEAGDDELVELIGLLGGTEAAALAHPELRELVLPAIRADYRLLARYRAPLTELAAPVVVYCGDADPDLDQDAVEAWSAVAGSTFDVRRFGGGHFYLTDQAPALLDDLFARLKPTA
ncbi:thioesterase II family protein [Streptomyces sp. NPDC057623]|uniref:thioesterase II family protein n=1 Tax=Streptomyces sp. NPDC057623 TaxID=3346187 RepID=UPI0036B34A31